jgi:hypothetical protein
MGIACPQIPPFEMLFHGVSKGDLLYFDNFLLTNDKNSAKMWQNGDRTGG